MHTSTAKGLLACSVAAASLSAQSADLPEPTIGTRAEVMARVNPEYPRRELRKGAEGWVQLSYVISPTGDVTDVVVVDAVGSRAFIEPALSAVRQWKYAPATWEGKPVEQCNNLQIIKFVLDPPLQGGRSKQMDAYMKINRLIKTGRVDEANALLEKAIEWDLNSYEMAFFNLQLAELARMEGRPDAEFEYLGRAAVGEEVLGRRTDRAFLKRLFISAASTNHVATALNAFEELERYSSNIEDWHVYEDIRARLIAHRDGDGILVHDGVIEGERQDFSEFWRHDLLRRSIEFGGMSGELGKFELRCDRKYLTDGVAGGRNWTLPEEWGHCEIYVFGKPGSSFKLYELPPPSAATSSPAN